MRKPSRQFSPVIETMEPIMLMSVAYHQPPAIHAHVHHHRGHHHPVTKINQQSAQAVFSPKMQVVPVPFEAISGLNEWKADMLKYGASTAAYLALHKNDVPVDPALGATYYDSARTYMQIYKFTGDPKWLAAEKDAIFVYRDRYAASNNFSVPGYWLFTTGLLDDYYLTGDPASKNAVIQLSLKSSYAPDTTPAAWTVDQGRSREVAYNIIAELNAEKLGAPHRARTDLLATQALGHIQQWLNFGKPGGASYVRPFMVGLTCDALIQYQEATGDARVLPAVKSILDWTWTNCWLPASGAFKYTNIVAPDGSGGINPAPDLNLLIVNSYGWLAQQVGTLTTAGKQYNAEADAIFLGGVKGAYLVPGKQFNQNYKDSFDYVNRRLGN